MDEKKTFEVEIVFKFDSQQSWPPQVCFPRINLSHSPFYQQEEGKVLCHQSGCGCGGGGGGSGCGDCGGGALLSVNNNTNRGGNGEEEVCK